MPEETSKKTVKRAARRTTAKVAPRKTVVRKTATASVRKAPARRTPAPVRTSRTGSKIPVLLGVFFLIVLGASAAVGFSDKGSIDVSQVITTRKQNATAQEQEQFKTVPVQQTQPNVVNGGLVGTGKSQAPEPPAVTDTATSSERSATTTDEVSDQSDDQEQTQESESVDEAEMEETGEAPVVQ